MFRATSMLSYCIQGRPARPPCPSGPVRRPSARALSPHAGFIPLTLLSTAHGRRVLEEEGRLAQRTIQEEGGPPQELPEEVAREQRTRLRRQASRPARWAARRCQAPAPGPGRHCSIRSGSPCCCTCSRAPCKRLGLLQAIYRD